MTDYERGPYTPPAEAPLAFDPRRPVRGSGPLPVTLVVSGLVLVGLIAAVVFIYRGGVRAPGDAPAPVGAPLKDIKAAAPADGSSPDGANGLTITKSDASNAAPVFTAPPEQPQLRAGPDAAPAAQPAVQTTAAQPALAVPPPAPVTVLRPPAAPVTVLRPSAAPDTSSDVAPPPPPPTPALRVASAAPAPRPAPAPKPVARVAATTSAPVKPAAEATPPATGWVQIGAFSSNAQAESGWNDVARLRPAKMAGKGKRVEPIERGGSTLYRTYITGFATRSAAVAFCDDLKTAGKSCFVK